MAKKKPGLGRGLSALLSDVNTPQGSSESQMMPKTGIAEVEITLIQANPYQPRSEFDQDALHELADSIKTQGIIQPITVRKLGDKYQLISGERRLQASKIAGLTHLPAYIRTANDQQMLEMALIENIQRENLNPVEIALSYQRLMTECGLRQEDLGDRVGKNRATVANYLRLLRLPPEIQMALRRKDLSMGHARAIVALDKTEDQLYIFKRIIEQGLSVRKVEELVRQLLSKPDKPQPKPAPNPVDYDIRHVQQRLSTQFGTRVRLNHNDSGKGEISIPYQSVEDLNRILDLLE